MRQETRERVRAWAGYAACVGTDAGVMAVAYLAAFLLRFDFFEPYWGWRKVAYSFVTVLLVQVLALAACGCYRLVWRYLTVTDIPRFVVALVGSTAVLGLLRVFLPGEHAIRPPYSVTFLNGFLVLGGLLGVRLLWRLVADGDYLSLGGRGKSGRLRRVLLVGAGSAGNLVARELKKQSGRRMEVVGFLDDDPSKRHAAMQGYPVLGRVDELAQVVRRKAVDEVIVSMVRVSRDVVRRVVRLCEEVQVPARIVPGYYELIDGTLTASKIRDIDVADLLGREEVRGDVGPVVALLGHRRVLVTGAGGTIGSELVRQILRAGPERLVLVERSENALYEIEREIRGMGLETPVVALLADIGDERRMREVLDAYRPQLVVHAAAHKHVPMMEQNPSEAIRNNVLATRLLGELSVEFGVERFVYISTDKAVRPVSVMGVAKRLGEIALRDLDRAGGTRFAAVRFGNVLDSSGSVVPLFREQIRKGQAVTVTHPEMTRYFMTISEAVSLVLQAAALAKGGEIFVLDMGEPVRILELAEEMIALSGLRPHEEVPILFTGIRPGEKLHEELDVSERSAFTTGHARIFVSKCEETVPKQVSRMLEACRSLGSASMGVERLREEIRRLYRETEGAEAKSVGCAKGEGVVV